MMSGDQAAQLELAIHSGNIEQSQLIARQLAEVKAKIIVRMNDKFDDVSDVKDLIRYFVFLTFTSVFC